MRGRRKTEFEIFFKWMAEISNSEVPPVGRRFRMQWSRSETVRPDVRGEPIREATVR